MNFNPLLVHTHRGRTHHSFRPHILLAVALMLLVVAHVRAQEPASKSTAPRQLTPVEERLVSESRALLLGAGLSESYFDQHFTLVSVVDKPGDTRVTWRFKIDEYETVLNDSVGSYTDKGQRVFLHSITNLVPRARDIKRTIGKRRAETLMRRCIGQFEGGGVVYQSAPGRPAALVFTAQAVTKPRRGESREAHEREEREKHEREERERKAKGQQTGLEGDMVEDEAVKRVPVILGSINLETGRCTRGKGIAGPPRP